MKCHQNMSESWTHYKQILELWGRCSSSGPWSKEVILTGVLWDQSWCVPVHQQWEYIMYRHDTNLGMHHVTNSVYSCLCLLMNDGLIWINGMKTWSYTCFQNFFVLTSHINVTIPLHTHTYGSRKERLKPSHRPNSPRTNIIPLQAGHCLGQFQRWSFILEHLMVYTQITSPAGWGWFLGYLGG